MRYMRQSKLDAEVVLERIGDIEKTLEFLKRDIIKGIEPFEGEAKISLYGSVKGGGINDKVILISDRIDSQTYCAFF